MGKYAVVQPDGIVQNVILWDGIQQYDPGPGLTLTDVTAKPEVEAEGKLVNGVFTPAPKIPVVKPQVDRLTDLLVTKNVITPAEAVQVLTFNPVPIELPPPEPG